MEVPSRGKWSYASGFAGLARRYAPRSDGVEGSGVAWANGWHGYGASGHCERSEAIQGAVVRAQAAFMLTQQALGAFFREGECSFLSVSIDNCRCCGTLLPDE